VGEKDAGSQPIPKAHWVRVQFALTVPAIRNRVAEMAAVLVLEPIFEADLQPEQYAYRRDRSALDAVNRVHKLIYAGHQEIVDADLSSYFDGIPHSELLKSVARRVVDGAMLHLIKMWLEAPVEETDEDGNKRRNTRNRDEGRGTPQGAPISPLLSNLYMRRFVLGWKKLGHEKRLKAYIINYADDLVICCRAGADEALNLMRNMMTRLKLTVNESKTRVCRLPGLTVIRLSAGEPITNRHSILCASLPIPRMALPSIRRNGNSQNPLPP
jgi:RNA-directed DNA polymerase